MLTILDRYLVIYLLLVNLFGLLECHIVLLLWLLAILKKTRKGAWVEAISNIVISIILVIKFGIVGVAIGTLVAMLIRTIEFIYHTNKYILKRNIFINIKKIISIIVETIIIVLIVRFLPLSF